MIIGTSKERAELEALLENSHPLFLIGCGVCATQFFQT